MANTIDQNESIIVDWDWLADQDFGAEVRALEGADRVVVKLSNASEVERLQILFVHTLAAGDFRSSIEVVLDGDWSKQAADTLVALIGQVTANFARTYLYSTTEPLALRLKSDFGASIRLWNGEASRASLLRDSANGRVGSNKIALLFTSMWGRVGSSVIFDGQTRYLISRGFLVVRILVDQWPEEALRKNRLPELVRQELSEARPFLAFVAERDTHPHRLAAIHDLSEFRSSSPIHRIQMLLRGSHSAAHAQLSQIAAAADLAIVNHVALVDYAKTLTRCPIVLETQDIASKLIDVHGVPAFVPSGPDSMALRLEEERATWRSVAACVNISAAEHAFIAKTAPLSFHILPYAGPASIEATSVPEFDVLLWGSNHKGNVDGILWFINDVVPLDPLLRAAKICVAGGVSVRAQFAIKQDENVQFLGVVPLLAPYFRAARVLVIPDQAGSGLSIKLMDAVRHGCCFATTSAGVRGLDVEGLGFTPSMTANEMAVDIARLLTSDASRLERANQAQHIYLRNFSEQTYQLRWDCVLDAVKEQARRPLSEELPRLSMVPTRIPPALSVIVCTYNRYEQLAESLASLLCQDMDSIEILVVDNYPNQASARHFARAYQDKQNVRYILEPIPGLSRARNLGFKASQADIVAFIDDDAVADPTWARRLVEAYNNDDRVGAVGGRISPIWPGESPDWVDASLHGFLGLVDRGDAIRRLERHEWIAGCNMSFRRATLEQTRGFSDALGRKSNGHVLMANEELEILQDVWALGQAVVYTPFAHVHHYMNPMRLNEPWFYKRVAWQAVSDFLTPSSSRTYEFATSAPQRFYRHGKSSHPNAANDRIMSVYDVVAVCLAGEFRFPDFGNGENFPFPRRKSRFWRNLTSLPNNAVKHSRRLLSKLFAGRLFGRR